MTGPVPPAPPAGDDPWMTVEEIAGRLRVSRMSVHRLIDAGQLRHVRIRSSIRVRRSWVQAYLRSRRTPRVADRPAGERLMSALDYRLAPPGTPRLTPAQVAVVLHALADHSALEAARVYSRDHPAGSGQEDAYWPTSTSIGRWMHDVAGQLEEQHRTGGGTGEVGERGSGAG